MKTVSILTCALLFIISCQQITQQDAQIGDSLTTPILEKHFNADEIKAISSVIKYFEKGMCTGPSAQDLPRCYDLHAHGLRSDFINKIPTQYNYPYNTNDGLHQIQFDEKFSNVWSNECKFVNDKNGKEVNFYCYNLTGSYVEYLNDISNTSSLIKTYVSNMINNNGLGNEMIHAVMMTSVDELNFKNTDHRIFYTLHYLTQRDQNIKNKMLASL